MTTIQTLLFEHNEAVLRIYQEGLQTAQATFETEVPSWETWNNYHHRHSRLVAIEEGKVVGWAALSPFSARTCYNGVAELSIYIAEERRGNGIGSLLMEAMIKESEANRIWTLYSSTFESNVSSIKLQKKWGFRVIGYRERIARLGDTWHNTVMLERRSNKVVL